VATQPILEAIDPSYAARLRLTPSGRKVHRSRFIPGLRDVCTVFQKGE
jgi:hypothetical protein